MNPKKSSLTISQRSSKSYWNKEKWFRSLTLIQSIRLKKWRMRLKEQEKEKHRVNDGRFFMGGFYCMDKQGNIILQDAVEYRATRRSSPSPMEQRGLGLILIPSSCRISCHVDCSIDEQLSLLSIQGQK
ncbi:hypothetical protein LXL04_027501 [Taraxacum kok-saghyz]